jgi:predicted tellurium resistance membrane protein TerC
MEWLTNADVWASFVTLTALEIVLGVDNLIFVALLAGRLPEAKRERARKIGLIAALGARLALLWSIVLLVHLTKPVFWAAGRGFSLHDLILIGGGAFLVIKGGQEIRASLKGENQHGAVRA